MDTTFLVLDDGTVLKGVGFGAAAPYCDQLQEMMFPAGEVVFNTSMTGYPEILSDPSYNGQMVVMTYPHIGNYGCDPAWAESTLSGGGIHATALIVRQAYNGPIPPGRIALDRYLKENGTCAISGVDTRFLTIHLRTYGARNGLLVRSRHNALEGTELVAALQAVRSFPSITERNLIDGVTVRRTIIDPSLGPGTTLPPKHSDLRFAVIDYGIKKSIINELYKRNIAVTLLGANATAKEILSLEPTVDAVFLSNGPGDPALLQDAVTMARELVGKLPLVGICLGHQLITWALGGKTVKMKFGHHGGNHPVRDQLTGNVFVTSQNHGFMTDPSTIGDDIQVWFTNANDGSIEGIYHKKLPVMSVQYHPEASPGPQDATWIFDRFIACARTGCTTGDTADAQPDSTK